MEWYIKVLKQYANFSGRARRKEYWMFYLVDTLISLTLTLIATEFVIPEVEYVETIYTLALLVPSLAVAVRRMHDVGKSGWYCLIPIYNLILACTDSEPGPNKWGDNPKGIGNHKEIDLIGKE